MNGAEGKQNLSWHNDSLTQEVELLTIRKILKGKREETNTDILKEDQFWGRSVRGRGNRHSLLLPPPTHTPSPASAALMDFPSQGKLYLAGVLEEWEGNIC